MSLQAYVLGPVAIPAGMVCSWYGIAVHLPLICWCLQVA